jgi:hypothetical protein
MLCREDEISVNEGSGSSDGAATSAADASRTLFGG